MSRGKKKEGINLVVLCLIILITILIIIGIVRGVTKVKKIDDETSEIQLQGEMEEEKNIRLLSDGTKLNISPKLNTNKDFNGLLIKGIQLTYKDGVTNLLAKVVNTTEERTEMIEIEIDLINKNGDSIYKWQGIIGDIEPNEETILNNSITADLSNAYDFRINQK